VSEEAQPQAVPRSTRLREVAPLFLKLGFIAFGGPAAHIAMMRGEVVDRRRWITEAEFLDLLGASNLIPGPTSTEMAIYLGYIRAGIWGLIAAGTLFILPAMCIVLLFAWAYVRFGSTPDVGWLLYGIKPVIIAVVLQAIWSLGRAAITTPAGGVLGIAVVAGYFTGLNPLILLFGAALLLLLYRSVRAPSPVAGLFPVSGLPRFALPLAAHEPHSLLTLFLTFLKIGAVLYGSGYVLLAFLNADFVGGLHWLTERQLIDAVAVGQVTPGPVFTTATFIGYLVAGVPGALLATLAIFLPSFFLVPAVYPLVPRLRRSPRMSAFLDGVNVAAVGLMAAVTIQLAQAALVDLLTVLLALLAAVLLVRYRVNSAWLVIGGGLVGLGYHALAAEHLHLIILRSHV
jgi:chromate transporter